MSDPAAYLWLIPALPLAAAAVNLLLAVGASAEVRKLAHWPSILAVLGSCVLSVLVLTSLPPGDPLSK